MPRLPNLHMDPNNPKSIAGALTAVARIMEQGLEFGDPNRITDPDNTDLAGDTSVDEQHNGTVINIQGSWVEVELTGAATVVTCNHNLFRGEPEYALVTGSVNCRWQIHGLQHDGTGLSGAINVTPWYDSSQAITANSIDLTFHVTGTLTVDASHKMKVTLFFTKAVR